MAPFVVWLQKIVPNVCRKTHQDPFLEVTSKQGPIWEKICWQKSHKKLFGQVWGNSGENPSHPPKFGCSYNYGYVLCGWRRHDGEGGWQDICDDAARRLFRFLNQQLARLHAAALFAAYACDANSVSCNTSCRVCDPIIEFVTQ